MGSSQETPQAQPALIFLPAETLPRRLASAVYACSLCEKDAGTVEIWVSDAAGKGEVVVAGLVGVVHIPLAPQDAPRLARMLSGGAAALYRHDREWASFYCPACERAYCQKHWVLQVQFEDDPLPGWYDCTYGTCPEGHRRMVDD